MLVMQIFLMNITMQLLVCIQLGLFYVPVILLRNNGSTREVQMREELKCNLIKRNLLTRRLELNSFNIIHVSFRHKGVRDDKSLRSEIAMWYAI